MILDELFLFLRIQKKGKGILYIIYYIYIHGLISISSTTHDYTSMRIPTRLHQKSESH